MGAAESEIGFEADDQTGPLPLRAVAARARGLSLASQMSECVDLLQIPDILSDDLRTSIDLVVEAPKPAAGATLELASRESEESPGFFYSSRELFVRGDGCSFTCLATALDFVASTDGETPTKDDDEGGSGIEGAAIDYAAVTCEARPHPLLGFTQHSESESAYPLLMRGLAGLVELLQPRHFDVLDREVYRGLLGAAPVFDLVLVLWDDAESDARRPLCELTRDLAEHLKQVLDDHPRFPPVLRDIVCLRMNNKRFDGRLRFVWRV